MRNSETNTNTPNGDDLLVWMRTLKRLLSEASDPFHTPEDQMWHRKWYALVGESIREITILRRECARWKRAAEAYEMGATSRGDLFIDTARRGNGSAEAAEMGVQEVVGGDR